MYCNSGAADRLDFTVIGPAVNLVSRLATLNRLLDVPLVFSTDYAAHWDGPARSLGRHELRGFAVAQEVFTLAKDEATAADDCPFAVCASAGGFRARRAGALVPPMTSLEPIPGPIQLIGGRPPGREEAWTAPRAGGPG